MRGRDSFLILNQISWKRAALEPYHNSVSTIRTELEAYLLLSRGCFPKPIGTIMGHVFHLFDRDKHIYSTNLQRLTVLIDVSRIHASTF